MPRRNRTIFLASALAAVTGSLCAGTPADPTRPPAKWLAAQTIDTAKEQPMVTTIIVHSDTRKLAVVDGVLVRIGETYNGDRLVAIKRNEVVWKRSQRPEVDTSRPAIVKRTIKTGDSK